MSDYKRLILPAESGPAAVAQTFFLGPYARQRYRGAPPPDPPGCKNGKPEYKPAKLTVAKPEPVVPGKKKTSGSQKRPPLTEATRKAAREAYGAKREELRKYRAELWRRNHPNAAPVGKKPKLGLDCPHERKKKSGIQKSNGKQIWKCKDCGRQGTGGWSEPKDKEKALK